MRKFEVRKYAAAACGALLLLACASAPGQPPLASDADIAAAERAALPPAQAAMTPAYPPFHLIGDIYYVGAADVSSFLITTPDGHFLLDGGLPQTAPQILANVRTLGFDIRDVRYLLNSHAHFDHAGGLAALQRASGATMAASAPDRATLEAGRIGYGPSAGISFPPIRVERVISDGDALTLGDVTLTAHLTPGHTPGCTSWSMETRGADGAPHRVFFHCSSTVAGQSLAPESYPGVVADYRAAFARLRDMRADVFLAGHAAFYGLQAKRERQLAGDADAFVDPEALQRFNAEMERQFEAELARQQAAARP